MTEQLQSDMLAQIMGELAQLREKVASQEAEIARLKTASTSVEVVSEGKPHHNRTLTTSRRRLLGKLAAGALVAGVAGTTALASQPAQAKVTSDNFTTTAFTNVGAVVNVSSGSYSNTPPASYNYGLVAAPAQSGVFDLSTLPSGNVGAFGQSSTYGVYGRSNGTNNNGAGVYGSGVTTSSLNTNVAYGVYGTVSGNGTNYGVYGTASSGVSYGVYGESGNGGIGVWGKSPSGTGVAGNGSISGVTGTGDTYGVFGDTTTGYGVYARAETSGYGVYAFSGTNFAIYSQGGIDIHASGSLPALRISPVNSTPTSSVSTGAIYVDSSGNLFVYNGTAWKQVQYI